MIELPIKESITALLANEALTALIRDRTYSPNPHVTVSLEGDLNFTISMENDALVITCHDLKPKVSYSPFSNMKRLARLDGRLSKITVTSTKIVLGIDGLPDQSITLT